MRSTRAVGPDALRLVGVLAIVIGHAIPLELVRQVVYPWHVAIFFVLTGYFWKSGRSVRDEADRRWSTLLLPYFSWLAIIGVPLLAYEAWTEQGREVAYRGVTFVLGGTYVTSPFEAFWFVCALFVAAVLYRSIAAVTGTAKAPLLCLLVLPLTLVDRWAAVLPYSVGVGAMALFFVAAGHLFQTYRERLGWAWFLPLVAGVLGFVSGIAEPLDMKAGDWGTPVVSFVAAALLCVGLIGLFESLFRQGGPRWVSTAAGLSLVVVLTHGVPLYLIAYGWPWWAVASAALAFGASMAYLARSRPALGGHARPQVVSGTHS